MSDATITLPAGRRGGPPTADPLSQSVYNELRKLAARRLARERPGQTLDPTALVNEAYLRIVGTQEGKRWDGRGHFFAAAAEAMRRILVENARRKGREKHGGGRRREHADLDQLGADGTPEELLALDEALEQFGRHDPLRARLVELRFFAGLTQQEAADCLGISLSTADRAWRYARAWLYAAMNGHGPEEK
jgi:RNA polymerase sigma factor (TIGR02999 family)